MRIKIIATSPRLATVIRTASVDDLGDAINAARTVAEEHGAALPRVHVYRNAGCRGMILLGAWQHGTWSAA